MLQRSQLRQPCVFALPQYDIVVSNLSNAAGIKTSPTSQFCFVCNLTKCKFVTCSEIALTSEKRECQLSKMVFKKPHNMVALAH